VRFKADLLLEPGRTIRSAPAASPPLLSVTAAARWRSWLRQRHSVVRGSSQYRRIPERLLEPWKAAAYHWHDGSQAVTSRAQGVLAGAPYEHRGVPCSHQLPAVRGGSEALRRLLGAESMLAAAPFSIPYR
jgi:hypothetical protein